MEKSLEHLFINSSTSYFFNKTDFAQYISLQAKFKTKDSDSLNHDPVNSLVSKLILNCRLSYLQNNI